MQLSHRYIARLVSLGVLLLSLVACSPKGEETITLHILHTTDVHGNFLPFDYVKECPTTGSMARLASYVGALRAEGEQPILLDGGDLLQGEPITYYYNYVDTTTKHVAARMLDYLQYDAMAVGNHDVETGHRVYDRFVRETVCPLLSANILRDPKNPEATYFTPYTMVERSGVRIAILGLTTPAIPQWLPSELYEGMYFADGLETARHWLPIIQKKENPDVVIALLHAGRVDKEGESNENFATALADSVAGIDLILYGHDHQQHAEQRVNPKGDSIFIINPANHLDRVSDVSITLHKKDGKVVSKRVEARFTELDAYDPDEEFMKQFAPDATALEHFVKQPVVNLLTAIRTEDALFGFSDYLALIHDIQLTITGAKISFAAPLSVTQTLPRGELTMGRMFAFYPYENYLYVMKLSGQEIKDYLEYSYSHWVNQMKSASDHILLLEENADSSSRFKTKYPTFNFSSAAGIDYTVDVSKPAGQRVKIEKMSSGEPFLLDDIYTVALNSYRGNGGGGLLTKGAGIPKDQLADRILWSTIKEVRTYMIDILRSRGSVLPPLAARPNWHFVPDYWAESAIVADRQFLFGKQ